MKWSVCNYENTLNKNLLKQKTVCLDYRHNHRVLLQPARRIERKHPELFTAARLLRLVCGQ